MTDLGDRETEDAEVGRFVGEHHVEDEAAREVADDQRPDGQRREYCAPRHRLLLSTPSQHRHCRLLSTIAVLAVRHYASSLFVAAARRLSVRLSVCQKPVLY